MGVAEPELIRESAKREQSENKRKRKLGEDIPPLPAGKKAKKGAYWSQRMRACYISGNRAAFKQSPEGQGLSGQGVNMALSRKYTALYGSGWRPRGHGMRT